MAHVLIWEFRVRPGSETAFERAYASDGTWAALFRKGQGYLGTELLKSAGTGGRYLTIDRWESAESYDQFRSAYADEYAKLDAQCEAWTEGETALGTWTV